MGWQGNDGEASGSSCFSVLADVNEIARWHLNALQKDRSLLLQLSHGPFVRLHSQKWSDAVSVGVTRALYLSRPRGLFHGMCLP